MDHQGVRGYGTYCHIKNANNVFKSIDKWQKKISRKEVKVKLHDREDVCTLSELKGNLCGDYFKRYFENPAKEGPLVLPDIPRDINKVVDTMERWCNDTNQSSDLKGLVVHNFNIADYFGKLFNDEFEKEKLLKDLDIKHFPSTPIMVVYNPSESVILLIRRSGTEGLREQIEFCSDDMKMFLLLFGDGFKRSRIKVISLLASYETVNESLECEGCKNCIVSYKTLESDELFHNWFHNHAENFNIDNDNFDDAYMFAASTKLIGCLAAATYFDDLPTFTRTKNEQMKHLLVFLTPAQKNILYSSEKHLIIQGPYGSGKSFIARKKLQMLSDELKRMKKSEVVHFICFDPISALISETKESPNVRIHGNKKGEKLSEMVKNILKLMKGKNTNLIVDEYDGENLDREEAETLNGIFQEKFQNTVVFLVPQSMEKERKLSTEKKPERERKNRFDLLKYLKRVDLNLVMRNSIEISNLIWVTENFLKEEETIFQHPREEDVSKDATYPNESENQLAEAAGIIKTKKTYEISPFRQKKANHVNNQEHEPENVWELPLSEAVDDVKKSVNIQLYKATKYDGKLLSPDGKDNIDIKNQDECAVPIFGLDEAFGFSGTPRANKDDINRIVTRFKYISSGGIGHDVNSHCPKLFEVVCDNIEKHPFEKFCAVTHIFEKIDIKKSNSKNKHVILHFDTSTNDIPKLLAPVIEYLNISGRVTNEYKEFKNDKSKSVLFCNFRLLRGLEHSSVTIIIDQDIYSVQHYLVEAMARCTNKLNIVVLEESEALSKITAHWKEGLNGKQLVEPWKIQFKKGKKEVEYQKDTKRTLTPINDSSRNLEKMQKIYDKYKKQNRSCSATYEKQRRRANEFIQER